MTFPKDHINIGRHGTKLPLIIPVVRKIFPLHISQFNKLVFLSIEGCHGRQLISIRFFFQCPESCIVKGKLCPVFFVEFILIAALMVVGIYVFVCKVLSSDIFFSAWMKIAVPVSTDLEDDMIFFIEDLCKLLYCLVRGSMCGHGTVSCVFVTAISALISPGSPPCRPDKWGRRRSPAWQFD